MLGVGPQQIPVKVRGWVKDTNYLLQGALWVEPSTWRRVQETSRPDARVANGLAMLNQHKAIFDRADAQAVAELRLLAPYLAGGLLGGWLVLPTRILYLIDETTGHFTRSGFAYGTVQGHWEHGEERFLIEWDHRDDSVWYDLLVFSRPQHPLARLAYPCALGSSNVISTGAGDEANTSGSR